MQPKVGACDNLGEKAEQSGSTLKALANARRLANTFGVANHKDKPTQGCANPGLQLANAFGVVLSFAPDRRLG